MSCPFGSPLFCWDQYQTDFCLGQGVCVGVTTPVRLSPADKATCQNLGHWNQGHRPKERLSKFWTSGPADQVFGQVPPVSCITGLDGELSVLGVCYSGLPLRLRLHLLVTSAAGVNFPVSEYFNAKDSFALFTRMRIACSSSLFRFFFLKLSSGVVRRSTFVVCLVSVVQLSWSGQIGWLPSCVQVIGLSQIRGLVVLDFSVSAESCSHFMQCTP